MLPLPAAHASDMLEWGILDCGPHGRVGDTGGGVMGSNTGLAVAAGTVSVPYSGLGDPPTDDIVMTVQMHRFNTYAQGATRDRQSKTAIFRALGFLGGSLLGYCALLRS